MITLKVISEPEGQGLGAADSIAIDLGVQFNLMGKAEPGEALDHDPNYIGAHRSATFKALDLLKAVLIELSAQCFCSH